MSDYPHSQLPLLPPEVVAARLEDPTFGEVLGRARAKGRREEYDPAVHYPFRYGGRGMNRVHPATERKINELIERWESRGAHWNRHLRAI